MYTLLLPWYGRRRRRKFIRQSNQHSTKCKWRNEWLATKEAKPILILGFNQHPKNPSCLQVFKQAWENTVYRIDALITGTCCHRKVWTNVTLYALFEFIFSSGLWSPRLPVSCPLSTPDLHPIALRFLGGCTMKSAIHRNQSLVHIWIYWFEHVSGSLVSKYSPSTFLNPIFEPQYARRVYDLKVKGTTHSRSSWRTGISATYQKSKCHDGFRSWKETSENREHSPILHRVTKVNKLTLK